MPEIMPGNIDNMDLMSIAVIGMSGRFPASPSVAAYWDNIAQGREMIGDLSDAQLVEAGVSQDLFNSEGYVKRGSYLEELEYFDAQFFDTTDREARIMAPSQRFLLICAFEALQDAGYAPANYPGRIGVYAGAKHCDSWQRRLYQLLDNSEGKFAEQLQFSIANDRDYSATRVSYKLDLKGPSLSINTACSTSLVAINQACKSLLSYDCDLALAGGSSIVVPQNTGYLYEEGGIGSQDGYCRAFDADASGTLLGNGAGVVLLKRLDEALAERDNIQAIIRGSAINNDGAAKVGFTAPSVSGQAQVISDALAVAAVPAESISYIEAHGTGTSLGDPIEIEALNQVFRLSTGKKQYCAIGSVKSNMGHLGSAAGVASFIKTVQALKHKQFPPSLYYERPNPEIDFENSPFCVNTELQEWPRNGTPRRAGVSSFGVGGTNAHLILEEAPQQAVAAASRKQQLILLSAKSNAALAEMESNLALHLKAHPEIPLADAAYTLQVGRETFPCRSILVGSDLDGIVEGLQQQHVMRAETGSTGPQSIAFMFPGQGAQHVNMGLELYRQETVFRDTVDQCAELLQPMLKQDLRKVLYPEQEQLAQAEVLLTQTAIAQPALFVVEYALAALWQSWGIRPDRMIGHSVGEYVAACLAEVFPLATALELIASRGRLMQSMPAGKMLAVQLSETALAAVLKPGCSIAAVNAKNWCVASGSAEAIDALQVELTKRHIDCRSLHTSHAFHSAMMEPVVAEFEQKLRNITLRTPRIPFVSNVTGQWITDSEAQSPAYWGRQLRGAVQFYQGARILVAENTLLLEVGPGQTLSRLLALDEETTATILPSCRAMKQQGNDQAFLLQTLGRLWLAGVVIDWSTLYGDEQRFRVSLPSYAFQKRRYWLEPVDAPARIATAEMEEKLTSAGDVGEPMGIETDLAQKIRQARGDARAALLTAYCRQLVTQLIGNNALAEGVALIELGMDSLTAIELRTLLQNTLDVDNVPVTLLLEEETTVDSLAAYLNGQLAECALKAQPSLSAIDRHNEQGSTGGVAEERVSNVVRLVAPEPKNKYLPFPLTDIQQAYWLGRDSFFTGGNISTHAYMEMEVTGLEPGRYQAALNQLIQRHDMLRAIFLSDGSQQFLDKVPTYEVCLEDFSISGDGEYDRGMLAVRDEMSHQVFAADQWPLFDIRLSKIGRNRFRIHYSIDLLIIDFSSTPIFFRELFHFYNGMAETLPHLEFSFRDYVMAEQVARGDALYLKSEQYWLQRTASLPSAPQLPMSKDPAQVFAPRFQRRESQLDATSWTKLKELAKQNKITPSVLLANTFSEVLAMWSRSPHFTLNLTIFNRLPLHPQANEIIGDFTSSILLEVNRSELRSFRENAKALQQQLLNDLEHRYFSGIRMLRAMNSQLGSQQAVEIPIVLTSALGLDHHRAEFNKGLDEVSQRLCQEMDNPVYSISQTSQVWLDHVVWEKDGALNFTWDALEEVFPERLLDDMFEAYLDLLNRLLDTQNNVWRSQTLITIPTRQAELRRRVNQSQASLREGLLHDLFRHQVTRTPDAIAVKNQDMVLSYRELHFLALAIGSQLRGQGVKPNQLVAMVMEKGWQQVAGALGIMYAGAAYMPIDATLPKERIWNLLEQGQVEIALSQEKFSDALVWPDELGLLMVTRELVPAMDNEVELVSVQDPGDLAYVIFTSGSTGVPKGVMIDHRAVVNTILDINQRFKVIRDDKVIAISSMSFDLSVYDVFGLLAAGGTVVIPEVERATDPQHWRELVQNENITIWNTVPALAQLFIESFDYVTPHWGDESETGTDLRLILMSGDWIPLNLPAQIAHHFPDIDIISLGGATEASIWSIYYDIEQVDNSWKSIPYGTPLANQQMHVLHKDLTPCPDWVAGDLHIAGQGLARGYWRDPQKSAASFFIHPQSGERLYKTGDQGRYFPDGNIEFLGRDDTQVKIQGHRIELGEIEAALNQYEGIKDSIVLVVGDEQSSKHLVGFVVKESVQEGEKKPDESDHRYLTDPLERAAFKLKQIGLRRIDAPLEIIPLPSEPLADSLLYMISPNEALQHRPSRQWSAAKKTISLDQIGGWLASIGQIQIPNSALPKYYYPSAGSTNPLQFYLYIKANSINGIMGGFYYYSPAGHQLLLVEEDISGCEGKLFPKLKSKERFAAFVVANKSAIDPLYGQYGVTQQFCALEAGHLVYMLSSTAPLHDLTLADTPCKNAEGLITLLGLDDGHVLMQSMVGGCDKHAQCETPISMTHFERQSYRKFLNETIDIKNFSGFLSCLANMKKTILQLPMLYIYIKPNRINKLLGGFYRYDFMADCIINVELLHEEIDDLHFGDNKKLFSDTVFSLLFVSPVADNFEQHAVAAGQISQALMTVAAKSKIGLCSVGGFNAEAIKGYLKLGKGEQPLYCIEGGRISAEQIERWETESINFDISSEWKAFLKAKLPNYMVPNIFMPIEEFPLTDNGKIDRKVLLEMALMGGSRERLTIMPRNEIEKKVLAIWQAVLSMNELGVTDNLFELGGDSLMAVQIVSQAAQVFNIEIPLHELFVEPTVEGMAASIVGLLDARKSYNENR